MGKVLPKTFFERPTCEVAEELLGCRLVIKRGNRVERYEINEVEAYDGFDDKASHAHRGRTPRNEVMFGEAGRWYVYFTYGMYHMLNVVVGPKEYPAAVLIRGAGEFDGPGKLTRGLGIDKGFNKERLGRGTGLWIEEGKIENKKIKKTPRIGIDSAGPVWKKKPYRFVFVK